MDTAKRALELLKTTDYEKALVKAAELKALNDERKSMTDDGVQQALDQLPCHTCSTQIFIWIRTILLVGIDYHICWRNLFLQFMDP